MGKTTITSITSLPAAPASVLFPRPRVQAILFDGWFTAAEGGEEIGTEEKKFGFTAADAENGKTMYAHWEKGIIVHFDGNGYKGTINEKTVAYDEVFSSLPYLSSYNYPEDKALDGWYIVSDGKAYGKGSRQIPCSPAMRLH